MKKFYFPVYTLTYNQSLVAISENVDLISKYLNQFAYSYFKDGIEYKTARINSYSECNTIMSSFPELLLHHFNDDIVLTDMEITHYSKIFREMYENQKIMISQCMMNNSILKLTPEEKKLNMDLFEMMHSKIYSYQSFLDSLDSDMLLKNYIIDPLIIKNNYHT